MLARAKGMISTSHLQSNRTSLSSLDTKRGANIRDKQYDIVAEKLGGERHINHIQTIRDITVRKVLRLTIETQGFDCSMDLRGIDHLSRGVQGGVAQPF